MPKRLFILICLVLLFLVAGVGCDEIVLEYTLDVIVQGEGTVHIHPDRERYLQGTEVELHAVPHEGSEFSSWQGHAWGDEEKITITMDGNKEITAIFTAKTYTLTVGTEGKGTVVIDPHKEYYDPGDIVTLQAIADSGWQFISWTGDYTGTEAEIAIEMEGNINLTAVFEQYYAILSVDYLAVGPSHIFRVWVWETNIEEGAGFKLLSMAEDTTPFGEDMSRITLEERMPLFIVDAADTLLAVGEIPLDEMDFERLDLGWTE